MDILYKGMFFIIEIVIFYILKNVLLKAVKNTKDRLYYEEKLAIRILVILTICMQIIAIRMLFIL